MLERLDQCLDHCVGQFEAVAKVAQICVAATLNVVGVEGVGPVDLDGIGAAEDQGVGNTRRRRSRGKLRVLVESLVNAYSGTKGR